MRMEIVITLGSNINQIANINKAKKELQKLFSNIDFIYERWTNPIGVESDKYLNCIAIFFFFLSIAEITNKLKHIEILMGDSHSQHVFGNVIIDIDLIRYGNVKLRKIIWLSEAQNENL